MIKDFLPLNHQLSPKPQPVNLKEWLKKAGIDAPPNVKVHFDFGPHGTETDASRSRERIRVADIILLEMHGWDSQVRDILHGISRNTVGRREIEQTFEGQPFILQLTKILKRGKVFIHPFDAPLFHESQIALADIEDADAMDIPREIFLREPPAFFDEAVREYKVYLDTYARNASVQREEYATGDFRNLIKQALIDVPALRKKKEIQTLIIYGSAHTSLQPRMQRMHPGLNTTRSLTPMPMLYSYRNEYMRNMSWGKTPDEEDMRHAFNESLAVTILATILLKGSKNLDYAERAVYERAIVDSMTFDEWRRVYEQMLIQKDIRGATDFVCASLRKASIPFEDSVEVEQWSKKELVRRFGESVAKRR